MADGAFSVLDTPGMSVDPEMTDKFRSAFAFDEKETLLGCELALLSLLSYPYTLNRLLRVYIQAPARVWEALRFYQLLLFQV